MNEYKKNIFWTSKFKSDFKQYKKDKKVCEKLKEAISYIANGQPLPPEFKNHSLKGNLKGLHYELY